MTKEKKKPRLPIYVNDFRTRVEKEWDLPDALRAIRHRFGYTLEEVSEMTGMHYLYIQYLETGKKNPTMTTLQKLLNAYGARVVIFFPKNIYAGDEPFYKKPRKPSY